MRKIFTLWIRSTSAFAACTRSIKRHRSKRTVQKTVTGRNYHAIKCYILAIRSTNLLRPSARQHVSQAVAFDRPVASGSMRLRTGHPIRLFMASHRGMRRADRCQS
eukprot:1176351-Prorocentrum_minimum.AAC.5